MREGKGFAMKFFFVATGVVVAEAKMVFER